MKTQEENRGGIINVDSRREQGGMRNIAWLSLLLLSACATAPRVDNGAADDKQAQRQSVPAPQPAASQKSAPAETPQSAPAQVQQPAPAAKPKHNVEED